MARREGKYWQAVGQSRHHGRALARRGDQHRPPAAGCLNQAMFVFVIRSTAVFPSSQDLLLLVFQQDTQNAVLMVLRRRYTPTILAHAMNSGLITLSN